MKEVRLVQFPWSDRQGELRLLFPDRWQVKVCEISGSRRKRLTQEEIRSRLSTPLSGPPLRERAKGKKEAVIVFDDMSRITPVKEVLPFILEELEAAGIQPKDITLISALGAHGAMDRTDFVRKLGEDVVSNYPVYNHNPFDGCVLLGNSRNGTPLSFNQEVVEAGFKIGIGAVVPHLMTGLSGGGKILLPGVAAFETIEAFHRHGEKLKERLSEGFAPQNLLEDNPLIEDIEEAVFRVGLDLKVDALLNANGEICELFVGPPERIRQREVKEALSHYKAPAFEADIVVANVFAKANEGEIGVITCLPCVRKTGGDLVLVCNIEKGHVVHYLMGTFGKKSRTRLKLSVRTPGYVRNVLVFTEYTEESLRDYFEEPEKVLFFTNWQELLSFLEERHPKEASVAVYPSADIHYIY